MSFDALDVETIRRILEEGGGMAASKVDALSEMSRTLNEATKERRKEIKEAKEKMKRFIAKPYIVEGDEVEGFYANPLNVAIYEAKVGQGEGIDPTSGGGLLDERGKLKPAGRRLKFYVDSRRGNTLVDGLGRAIDRGRQRVADLVEPEPEQ